MRRSVWACILLASCAPSGTVANNSADDASPPVNAVEIPDGDPVANAAPAAPNALTAAQLGTKMLGVAQVQSASGGRNEWVLKLDPASGKTYFGQQVDDKVEEVTETYQAPVADANGGGSLNTRNLAVTFAGQACESDHGALGAGAISAIVTVHGKNGDRGIPMCMVTSWPADGIHAQWNDKPL